MPKQPIKMVLAQLNFTVGDIAHNQNKILKAIEEARDKEKADLIIFPELAITGYPLEDLLHRPYLYQLVKDALQKLISKIKGIDVVLGYPEKTAKGNFNSLLWIRNGKCITNYRKQKLPNYGVFDEVRYFAPGQKPAIVNFKGTRFGLLICEDIWYSSPVKQATKAGAECLICINASPYSIKKNQIRTDVLKTRVKESHLPMIYVNLVGGQDELVFDGGSMAIDKKGKICARAPFFEEKLHPIHIDAHLNITDSKLAKIKQPIAQVYEALLLGIRDYVHKNNFKKVIIGVSGGIDSALTLCLAVDALGKDRVMGVMMPSPYTSQMSIKDATALCENLQVEQCVIPINEIYDAYLKTLKDPLDLKKMGATQENIQARIRGNILMALSNKTGALVLTTGNKSEMAVGYATLYGDMAGGFCVLKDIFKTTVYALCEYRNKLAHVIPNNILTRAPSAELAPNQKDQDTLPPYEILDKILANFIEKDLDASAIVKKGFDRATVEKIIHWVLKNEYKRRQAPPGIRISEKGFGRDRRYPITSAYLKS